MELINKTYKRGLGLSWVSLFLHPDSCASASGRKVLKQGRGLFFVAINLLAEAIKMNDNIQYWDREAAEWRRLCEIGEYEAGLSLEAVAEVLG